MENFIDRELCKSCKLCVEACPCKVIGMDKNDEVFIIQEREAICINCGQCMAICTTEAIRINNYSYAKDIIKLSENRVNYNDYIDFISNRRSIRNYKGQHVSAGLIDKIIDSVSYAPFGASPEEMHITVVNNRKVIESTLPYISNFLDDIVKLVENPIASFMIKRKEGIETFNTLKNHLYPISKKGNYKLSEGDRITRGAPSIIIFHAKKEAEAHTHNSLIYATYVMMAAQTLGLGSMMNGIVPSAINRVKEVKNIFQIPNSHEAVMSVNIGYPKYKYHKGIKRSSYKVKIIE